jgi:hypothetical protein
MRHAIKATKITKYYCLCENQRHVFDTKAEAERHIEQAIAYEEISKIRTTGSKYYFDTEEALRKFLELNSKLLGYMRHYHNLKKYGWSGSGWYVVATTYDRSWMIKEPDGLDSI